MVCGWKSIENVVTCVSCRLKKIEDALLEGGKK